jgi:hypothetical protein
MDWSNEEVELYDRLMEESEIIQNIRNIMSEIENKYSIFNEIYKRYYRNKISELDMYKEIREVLNYFTKQQLIEYNEMWKMFSTFNCGHSSYSVAQIVHNEIMKIWYPEEVKKQ